jgi:hypothetical protein
MKKNKKISQSKAIEFIKNGSFSNDYQVVFDGQAVYGADAILLGGKGILVPEELIKYNDDALDYSDIPSLSIDDTETGKIKWIINAEIPIDNEISTWLKQQKIDVNELMTQLLRNFYQTVKALKNNAAL